VDFGLSGRAAMPNNENMPIAKGPGDNSQIPDKKSGFFQRRKEERKSDPMSDQNFLRSKKAWMDATLEVEAARASVHTFSAFTRNMGDASQEILPRQRILSFEKVHLAEPREGVRITSTSGTFEGRTREGTIGVNIHGVGFGATSGKTRGTINTTSVAGPVSEEFTLIDSGRVGLESSLITFAGEKYSRSASYADIISWKLSDRSIGISVLGGEKNWLLVFGEIGDARLVNEFLKLIESTRSRTVDHEVINAMFPLVESELGVVSAKVVELERVISSYVSLAKQSGRHDAFKIYG
jgi:hypothetical protein